MGGRSRHTPRVWQNPRVLDFARRRGYESDPVRAAAEACADVLTEIDPDVPVRSLATDLERVSAALGVPTEAYEYGRMRADARLVQRASGALAIQIGDRARASEGRLRFAIAHELGHLIVRRGGAELTHDERREAASSQREEEVLCHFIASELLMPAGRFVRAIEMTAPDGPTPRVIQDLAKGFRVSVQAAINRVAWLAPDGVAVYWSDRTHPMSKSVSESQLRVRWALPQAPIRWDSFVPYHATAKNERFEPNVPLQCYQQGKHLDDVVQVSDFGGLAGRYRVVAMNLSQSGTGSLGLDLANKRPTFDVVTAFIPIGWPAEPAKAPEGKPDGTQRQLDLFDQAPPRLR